MIRLDVEGTPAPQGSKTGIAVKRGGEYTGRVAMKESSAGVKPWRNAIKAAVVANRRTGVEHHTLTGPVALAITYRMPRPQQHYGTGRNAGTLKPQYLNAERDRTPDIDKLDRSTLDGLTATKVKRKGRPTTHLADGHLADDGQVVALAVRDRYVRPGETTGATIIITPWDGTFPTPEGI